MKIHIVSPGRLHIRKVEYSAEEQAMILEPAILGRKQPVPLAIVEIHGESGKTTSAAVYFNPQAGTFAIKRLDQEVEIKLEIDLPTGKQLQPAEQTPTAATGSTPSSPQPPLQTPPPPRQPVTPRAEAGAS